jgi:hypothetical protein
MSASEQIDNINEKLNWHWRNSMRTVRFFAFDARSAIVILVLFFRLADPKAWLFVLCTFMFFRYLERKGLTFPSALRNFRCWIVGRERPGLVGVYHKKFRDYG